MLSSIIHAIITFQFTCFFFSNFNLNNIIHRRQHHNDIEKEIDCGGNVNLGGFCETGGPQDNCSMTVQHDENIEEPKTGMKFDTIEELTNFYADYGKKMGFGVCKKSSQKSVIDEEKRYATISCNRAGKSVSRFKKYFETWTNYKNELLC